MQLSEITQKNSSQVTKCSREGHQNFTCKRICVNAGCQFEMLCSECVLRDHADHLPHCLEISVIEKMCAEFKKKSHCKEMAKVDGTYCQTLEQLARIITKLKKENMEERNEFTVAMAKISNGKIGELNESEMKVVKELVFSEKQPLKFQQNSLPKKIQKEQKLLQNFLQQLKQLERGREKASRKTVEAGDDEQSNTDSPQSKVKEKFSIICSIQISKSKNSRKIKSPKIQKQRKSSNSRVKNVRQKKLLKLTKMLDNNEMKLASENKFISRTRQGHSRQSELKDSRMQTLKAKNEKWFENSKYQSIC